MLQKRNILHTEKMDVVYFEKHVIYKVGVRVVDEGVLGAVRGK